MSKPVILCVDDQREVLSAIRRELGVFESDYELVESESAREAEEVMNELNKSDQTIALIICDHIMPGENGVDFLARMNLDSRYKNTRKILLTGLASHHDTIKAINEAQIDFYLEKPWNTEKLVSVVKTLLN